MSTINDEYGDDNLISATVVGIARDEGTVVLLGAITDEGKHITIACDHRPAQAIADALEAGEDVAVGVEAWQIVGSWD